MHKYFLREAFPKLLKILNVPLLFLRKFCLSNISGTYYLSRITRRVYFCMRFPLLSFSRTPKVENVINLILQTRKELMPRGCRCEQNSHYYILPPSGRHSSTTPMSLKVKTF